MLVPRYVYRDGFAPFAQLFEQLPHTRRRFEPGEQLWRAGEYLDRVYYLESGVVKTAFVDGEGHGKTIYFHGAGMVFPGCHEAQFKLELSLVASAVTPTTALAFGVRDFQGLMRRNADLACAMVESYARYINMLIFETAHQERNRTPMRLANLIALLARDTGGEEPARRLSFSQEELAGILGANRVSVTRALGQLRDRGAIEPHRGWVEIADERALLACCSYEALPA